MHCRGIMLAVAGLVLATAGAAFAQPSAGPIPRFVVDVHGVSGGLPITDGWVPAAPVELPLPTRGLGLDGGAHVYVLRFGPAALGLGIRGMFVRGSGTTEPVEPPDTGVPVPVPAPAPAPAVPTVTVSTRLRAIAPEVSINFGHRLGWSYVSVGVGRAREESEASSDSGATLTGGPPGWTSAFNFGGGARWMVNAHVGFSFDLRWHQLSSIAATDDYAGAKRTRLFVAGAGVSIR